MLREISFTISEKPIPLKRHRHKDNKTYDPQKKEKLYYGNLIKQQIPNYPSLQEHLLCGPLLLQAKFYFPLPKSKQARKKKGLYHTSKPDLDNLVKYILDVMSHILYADDAYVYKIDAIKCYSDNPRTEITLKEIMQEEITMVQKKETNNGIIKKIKNKFFPAKKI